MRRMKDSGIAWIGEIPESWNYCKQKYQIRLINGRAYSDSEFEENGKYRILRVGNLFSNSVWYTSSMELDKDKYCEYGDILYAWSMSYVPVIWTGEKVIYHYHIWKLKINDDILKKFVFYYLLYLTDVLKSEIHETTMGFITMSIMNNSFIAFPSIEEQLHISDYLDSKCAEIDRSMELARQGIDKLKTYRMSVITEAVTKGLAPDVPMKDSGVPWIGEIPQHWDVEPIKYLYDYSNGNAVCVGPFGSSLPSSEICDAGVWVYNQRVVLDNNFDTNNIFINEKKAKELSAFAVSSGDILITTRGSIGKIAIVPDSAHAGILHPCVIRFRINNKKYSLKLLKYIFNESNIAIQQINYMNNSTTIGVLYSYSLKEIKLPTPPLSEQHRIAAYLDAKCAEIDAIIARKQELLDKLAAYKKSLIFECVTGKREVAA